MYYVDLTLREGVSLNDAIVQAKQIDEQSKTAGFYQEVLILLHGKALPMHVLKLI